MSKEEIDELPWYLACLLMGAISSDKTNLKMSAKDMGAYQIALAKRKQKEQHNG